MLTKRAMQLVKQAHPHDELALIVSVRAKPSDSAISAQPDRTARRRFVNEFYKRAKAPVIKQVEALKPDGVRIVDRLDGTPQLIIAAPAQAWRSVFLRTHSMLRTPNITVSTNEPEVAIAVQNFMDVESD